MMYCRKHHHKHHHHKRDASPVICVHSPSINITDERFGRTVHSWVEFAGSGEHETAMLERCIRDDDDDIVAECRSKRWQCHVFRDVRVSNTEIASR